jgi:PAS domain-containing protein
MSQTITNNIFNAFPLPSLLISVDSSFTIQNVNDAFLRETNKTEKELIGKQLHAYFTENKLDFTTLEQSLHQVITTKQTQTILVKTISEQAIELENIPILDEHKEVNLIIQSYKFINRTNQENGKNELELLKKYTKESLIEINNKQKELEAHFNALIENTPDLIYSIDLNFNLITFNSALSNLMFALKGVNLEPGMNILKHFSEVKREKYTHLLKKIIKQGRYVFEDEFMFNNEMLVFRLDKIYWIFHVTSFGRPTVIKIIT